MDLYNTLTLYKSALLKRVPFQLSRHFNGAIHSIITFWTFSSLLIFSCVVGVPHCGSVFNVWTNKTEIECLPNVHVSANSKISPDHI